MHGKTCFHYRDPFNENRDGFAVLLQGRSLIIAGRITLLLSQDFPARHLFYPVQCITEKFLKFNFLACVDMHFKTAVIF